MYDLLVKQIKHEITLQSKVRGLKKVSANPDFLIALHGGMQYWLDYTDWEYLHANYEKYAAKRKTDFSQYSDDTLIVDFIDTKKNGLIWQGVARGTVKRNQSREKQDKRINEAVTKLFNNFPPKE